MKESGQTDFTLLKAKVRTTLAPIKPSDAGTKAKRDFLFSGKKAIGAKELPPPYLIYFLLVELLNFKDLGRFEKLAWSIPVDFNNKAFLIEHRKFGVGVFIQDDEDQIAAKQIAIKLGKAVKCAKPYFKWKANAAVAASKFNVVNSSRDLLGRYTYLKNLSENKFAEAIKRKDEIIETKIGNGKGLSCPHFALKREGNWLGISAIEAFFGWTEHVFVHFAILRGMVQTGEEFSKISGEDWSLKFKSAIDISDHGMKRHYDKLIELRRQVRNFIAHGAFGKDGKTLLFHSSAGAVPVIQDVIEGQANFTLGESLSFNAPAAFLVIERFVADLKNGANEPAWSYVQDHGLPSILTMAQDGSYRDAMKSSQLMNDFVEVLSSRIDDAANMDW
jgi:hypothetical protein